MHRVIECDEEVLIGFNSAQECPDYWYYLGLDRTDDCFMYRWPIVEDERMHYELEYDLFDMDYFGPGLNCEAFIKVPKNVYYSVKDKVGELGNYKCTQEMADVAQIEYDAHTSMYGY
jgi:hypothetical protein